MRKQERRVVFMYGNIWDIFFRSSQKAINTLRFVRQASRYNCRRIRHAPFSLCVSSVLVQKYLKGYSRFRNCKVHKNWDEAQFQKCMDKKSLLYA
jgi:hypothetical protein